MLTTLRGTVELDPMRVPAAASMNAGRDPSFEDVLQQAVDAAPEADEAAPPEAAPAEAAPAEETTDEDRAPEEQAERDAPDAHAPEARDEAATAVARQAAANADVTETTRRGEPVRQETAGKGADSPRSSSARAGEPLIAAFAAHGATAANHGPVAVAGQTGIQGVAGAKAAGEGPARGIDGLWQRANTPTSAAAVAGGYRTNTVASAQLLEQARDSVFKQILMKLAPDGGEMHLRLDPPELGEVDLHMVVEGGNKLRLSIATERQDLTQLLQRHMDELKQSLEAQGLEVTDAQVRTRDGGSRGQRHGGEPPQHRDGDDAGRDARSPSTRRGGYVTAEGLDFWV